MAFIGARWHERDRARWHERDLLRVTKRTT
jgi:hypothetical protein